MIDSVLGVAGVLEKWSWHALILLSNIRSSLCYCCVHDMHALHWLLDVFQRPLQCRPPSTHICTLLGRRIVHELWYVLSSEVRGACNWLAGPEQWVGMKRMHCLAIKHIYSLSRRTLLLANSLRVHCVSLTEARTRIRYDVSLASRPARPVWASDPAGIDS